MDFPKLWPIVMFFFYEEPTNEQIQQFFGNLFQRQQHFLSKSKNKPVMGSSLFFKEWTGVSGPLTGGSEKNQRTYPELPDSFTHKQIATYWFYENFQKTQNQT